MGADRWQLRPGDFTSRQELNRSFGFPMQYGLGYSSRSQHVALHSAWSDVDEGLGWIGANYYYIGASSARINDVVFKSREQGRCLHLLERVSGSKAGLPGTRYVESFIFVDAHSKFIPDHREPGKTLEVPVFKLAPVSNTVHRPWQVFDSPAGSTMRVLPVQRHELVRWEDQQLAGEIARLGPEARLENSFSRYLLSQGVAFHRWQINFDESSRPLLTDVWIPGRRLLIETKSSTNRSYIREAIGQLADYARSVPALRRAILMPTEPSADLWALLDSQGIAGIWPDGNDGWQVSVDWLRGL